MAGGGAGARAGYRGAGCGAGVAQGWLEVAEYRCFGGKGRMG